MIAANALSTPGLCWTCNNSESCFFHAHRGPALFCELFDNYVSPEAILAAGSTPAGRRPFSVRAAGEPSRPQAGLCANCDNATVCGHSKMEGGIWHCEDYQ